MKKYAKYFVFALVSFFVALVSGKALEVNIDTIGEAIDSVNDTTQSVYIIGEYVFTTNHTPLTTQDIMLSGLTIKLANENAQIDGKLNEMTIYTLEREYKDYEATGKWLVKDNYVGDDSFPEVINLRYIDYKKLLNTYHITYKYNDDVTSDVVAGVKEGANPVEPSKPIREGYRFIGWYLDGELFKFDHPIDKDITLEARWQEAVDFEELLDLDAESFNGDDFGATFEEETLSINVNNKYRKISNVDLTELVTLIDNLLKNDKITSVVLKYNEKDYSFTTAMSSDDKESKIAELLDALAATEPSKVSIALAALLPIKVNSDTRLSSTLEKEFTISVTLKDGVALTENSKELYKVKLVSSAKDAEVSTTLANGFKNETTEFEINVKANDYKGEKVFIKFELPKGSYTSLQYCKTNDTCTTFDGTLGLDLDIDLADAIYKFKIEWANAGTFDYDIKVVDIMDSQDLIYAKTSGQVEVKEKFDVTFKYNDDDVTEDKVVQVVSGETVSAPEVPTREHYDFDAWYNGETKYEFDSPVTENITLNAKWNGKKYTAKFTGDGLDDSKYSDQTVTYPGTIEKPEDPTLAEHNFSGWFVDGVEFDFTKPLTKDVTIEAKWDIIKYSVEFFGEEGNSVKTENVESGSKVQAPELSKRGHKLSWHKDSADGELYDLDSNVTGNLKLFAKFDPIEYTVKFNGDDIKENEQKLTYPAKPQKPDTPTKEGYTFDNWYLGNNEEPFNFEDEILEEGEIILTGKWKVNTYRVTYKCDGCTSSIPTSQTYTYPDKPSEPTVIPTKPGYDFKYWYDESTDGKTKYDFNEKLLKDLTLVAKFDTKKLTINFELNLPSGVQEQDVINIPDPIQVEYGQNATEPTAPSIEGYDFLGWYNKYPTVSQTPFEFKETKILIGYTLVAKWQKKTYTVTFKVDDDELKEINNIEHGRTIEQRLKDSDMTNFVLSPYKEGERFDHWYLESDENATEYKFTTPVTSNITLKAKFVPVVNIDNLVGDTALKIKNSNFLASFNNNTITINVDAGDSEDEHSTAHNEDKLKELVENGNTGVAKAVKELADNENVASVKMTYDGQDYTFSGEEEAIKDELVKLLTAIAKKNSSTYEDATLNELIENDYYNNPLQLIVTLKEGTETIEGQSTPATYNVKVDSSVITVTNEAELNKALEGNYEAIKVGQSFTVSDTIYINRPVSIFGKSHTITLTKAEANAIFDIRHNNVAGGTTVNIKNLTLNGGKKGIVISQKTPILNIYNVSFADNSEMAMEINGKLHADGELSYNKEDYNHPFVRTPRSNAVTGTSTVTETHNIEVHGGFLDYEYDIIHKYGNRKYEDSDFKERDWSTGQEVIKENYCQECTDQNGNLKQQYSDMIGKDYINYSDTAEKTSSSHYYLKQEHSQYYTIVFRDNPSHHIIWRYVLYNEKPVEPTEPLPTAYFKSFARERTVRLVENGVLTEKTATYTLEGWSNNSDGSTKDYELDNIPGATQGRYYYTNYQKKTE